MSDLTSARNSDMSDRNRAKSSLLGKIAFFDPGDGCGDAHFGGVDHQLHFFAFDAHRSSNRMLDHLPRQSYSGVGGRSPQMSTHRHCSDRLMPFKQRLARIGTEVRRSPQLSTNT